MRVEPALPADLIALLGGGVAGCLGALVGIGGGVLLVPILNDLGGLSFREATAASLVGVLATSSSAAIVPVGKRLHNARLALLLLTFSVSGATVAGRYITSYSDRAFETLFGGLAAVIAGVMFVRLNRRNVLPPERRCRRPRRPISRSRHGRRGGVSRQARAGGAGGVVRRRRTDVARRNRRRHPDRADAEFTVRRAVARRGRDERVDDRRDRRAESGLSLGAAGSWAIFTWRV